MANTKKMDYVLLGLLSHESMTGYELKKRLDTSLRFFWGGSFGSIYPTLKLLEEDEKVTKETISENKREKILYSITGKGKETLKEWLEHPVEKDEIRYETLLKLFLGKDNGLNNALKHIDRFEKKIKAELQILYMFENELLKIIGDDTHKYYYLTVSFGIKTYMGYLEWCKESRDLINEWNK